MYICLYIRIGIHVFISKYSPCKCTVFQSTCSCIIDFFYNILNILWFGRRHSKFNGRGRWSLVGWRELAGSRRRGHVTMSTHAHAYTGKTVEEEEKYFIYLETHSTRAVRQAKFLGKCFCFSGERTSTL